MHKPNTRLAAADGLARIMAGTHNLTEVLVEIDAEIADTRDRALVRLLLFTVLRRFFRLRAALAGMMAKPLPAREQRLEALLLIGLAQLDGHIGPEYAAISESVDAARAVAKRHVSLANALLRRFQREKAALTQTPTNAPEDNHPQWLVDKIRQDWPEQAQTIFTANLAEAPLILRVNARHHDATAYLALLRAAGIEGELCAHLPYAVQLRGKMDVASLPGFDQGWVSVQDGAAQFATELLDLGPGMRMLDACAAPGGKTAAILEQLPQATEVVAVESSLPRFERLRANLRRLELAATLHHADAAETAAWWDGRAFDRILVDSPCSGTGVIRRHPDILLLRKHRDLAELKKTQERLLDALWPLLKPGGKLVYATCSILQEENDGRIASFLSNHPDARTDCKLPEAFLHQTAHGRQNLPGEHAFDGFYYSTLVHRA